MTDLPYASNSSRFLAYLIDVLPITLIAFLIYYFFFGFDEVFESYLENKEDVKIREIFLKERNQIRNLSLVIWVVYGVVMDCTNWQGTLGKKLMEIKVTDENGFKLNFVESVKRNFGKLISVIPLFIGVLWVFFDKRKRTLHDKMAKTVLLNSPSPSDSKGL